MAPDDKGPKLTESSQTEKLRAPLERRSGVSRIAPEDARGAVQFDVVFDVGRYMQEAIAWDNDGVPSLDDWHRRRAKPHELVEFAREYGAAGLHEAVAELEMAEKAHAEKGGN